MSSSDALVSVDTFIARQGFKPRIAAAFRVQAAKDGGNAGFRSDAQWDALHRKFMTADRRRKTHGIAASRI